MFPAVPTLPLALLLVERGAPKSTQRFAGRRFFLRLLFPEQGVQALAEASQNSALVAIGWDWCFMML
jgi:hypothetical protein